MRGTVEFREIVVAFLTEENDDYKALVEEVEQDLERPQKKNHWIWWMFPQKNVAGNPKTMEIRANQDINVLFSIDSYKNLMKRINRKPLNWFDPKDYKRVSAFRKKHAIYLGGLMSAKRNPYTSPPTAKKLNTGRGRPSLASTSKNGNLPKQNRLYDIFTNYMVNGKTKSIEVQERLSPDQKVYFTMMQNTKFKKTYATSQEDTQKRVLQLFQIPFRNPNFLHSERLNMLFSKEGDKNMFTFNRDATLELFERCQQDSTRRIIVRLGGATKEGADNDDDDLDATYQINFDNAIKFVSEAHQMSISKFPKSITKSATKSKSNSQFLGSQPGRPRGGTVAGPTDLQKLVTNSMNEHAQRKPHRGVKLPVANARKLLKISTIKNVGGGLCSMWALASSAYCCGATPSSFSAKLHLNALIEHLTLTGEAMLRLEKIFRKALSRKLTATDRVCVRMTSSSKQPKNDEFVDIEAYGRTLVDIAQFMTVHRDVPYNEDIAANVTYKEAMQEAKLFWKTDNYQIFPLTDVLIDGEPPQTKLFSYAEFSRALYSEEQRLSSPATAYVVNTRNQERIGEQRLENALSPGYPLNLEFYYLATVMGLHVHGKGQYIPCFAAYQRSGREEREGFSTSIQAFLPDETDKKCRTPSVVYSVLRFCQHVPKFIQDVLHNDLQLYVDGHSIRTLATQRDMQASLPSKFFGIEHQGGHFEGFGISNTASDCVSPGMQHYATQYSTNKTSAELIRFVKAYTHRETLKDASTDPIGPLPFLNETVAIATQSAGASKTNDAIISICNYLAANHQIRSANLCDKLVVVAQEFADVVERWALANFVGHYAYDAFRRILFTHISDAIGSDEVIKDPKQWLYGTEENNTLIQMLAINVEYYYAAEENDNTAVLPQLIMCRGQTVTVQSFDDMKTIFMSLAQMATCELSQLRAYNVSDVKDRMCKAARVLFLCLLPCDSWHRDVRNIMMSHIAQGVQAGRKCSAYGHGSQGGTRGSCHAQAGSYVAM